MFFCIKWRFYVARLVVTGFSLTWLLLFYFECSLCVSILFVRWSVCLCVCLCVVVCARYYYHRCYVYLLLFRCALIVFPNLEKNEKKTSAIDIRFKLFLFIFALELLGCICIIGVFVFSSLVVCSEEIPHSHTCHVSISLFLSLFASLRKPHTPNLYVYFF